MRTSINGKRRGFLIECKKQGNAEFCLGAAATEKDLAALLFPRGYTRFKVLAVAHELRHRAPFSHLPNTAVMEEAELKEAGFEVVGQPTVDHLALITIDEPEAKPHDAVRDRLVKALVNYEYTVLTHADWQVSNPIDCDDVKMTFELLGFKVPDNIAVKVTQQPVPGRMTEREAKKIARDILALPLNLHSDNVVNAREILEHRQSIGPRMTPEVSHGEESEMSL